MASRLKNTDSTTFSSSVIQGSSRQGPATAVKHREIRLKNNGFHLVEKKTQGFMGSFTPEQNYQPGIFQRSFAAAQRSAKLEASPCPGAPDRVSGQSQSSQTTKSLRWATAGKCHQAYLCSKARGSKNLCRYKDI